MAGDWIKIRPGLLTSPKVNGIARMLEKHEKVTGVLSTRHKGSMSEIVTRNVMRTVTLSSLVTIWGAANEHTRDGMFENADLSDLDDMSGIPGMGEAMAAVGWAIYDPEKNSVTLPNFNEYNTCGRDRAAEKNAERQRRYREKKKAEALQDDGDSNVTDDVTNNDREEKRREETTYSSTVVERCPVQKIIDLYNRTVNHLPVCRVAPDAIRKNISTRWKENEVHQTIEFWRNLFEYCEQNKFLSGRSQPGPDRNAPFRASLDWIVKPTNFAKIVNGNYDRDSETAAA